MLPRKIMVAATASYRTVSMAQTLQRLQIKRPVSLSFERYFSSQQRPPPENDGNPQENQEQQQPSEQISETEPQRRHPKSHRPKYNESDRAIADKKKWRAPFWLPPPPKGSNPNQNSNRDRRPRKRKPSRFETRSANRFRDAILPCRNHLDPNNSMGLPTSDWVHIFGALPMTSLEEVLDAIENILRKEVGSIVDLDADWNPHQDGEDPPLLPSILEVPIEEPQEWREYALDKDVISIGNENSNTELTQMESFRVVKAHVVLSPFGRPTGWNLQLANPSVVHALLSASQNARVKGTLKIGWKFARIKEYVPPLEKVNEQDTRTMLVVSDSMVRFENCPRTLTEDYLRHMLSRYELTPLGSTIIQWKGKTSDGKLPPLTFVVRFASPAYARAAVREMQGKILEGRPMKLIQYPRQLL